MYDLQGYQFWTQADQKGIFSIRNIRPGNYSLYAYVPGFIGDYKYDNVIAVQPGENTTPNLRPIFHLPNPIRLINY